MKKYLIVFALLLPFSAFALKFSQTQLVSAGDMSAASIISPGEDLKFVPLGSVSAQWTGAPMGTLKLQVSNDIVELAASVVNWSDFSGSSIAVNGAGDVTYNLANAGYRWTRIVYTKTSGTGTLNAILSAKGDY